MKSKNDELHVGKNSSILASDKGIDELLPKKYGKPKNGALYYKEVLS